MKTREEILSHRSERDEHHFGIQKVKTATEAFDIMDNEWGAMQSYGYIELRIGKNAFLDNIYYIVSKIYRKYLSGEYSEDKFKAALGLNEEYTTDELLDFNFFLYNKENNCYYTSMMEFGDDYMSVLSDRQWDIFFEIYNAYHLDEYAIGIINLLNEKISEEDENFKDGMRAWDYDSYYCDYIYDDWFDDYINLDKKYKIFGYGGEIKYPKVTQGDFRIINHEVTVDGYDRTQDIYGTREEAVEKFIAFYESCKASLIEKHGKDELEQYGIDLNNLGITLRDNSTGEEIRYSQIKS